jgi:hypothetical protein
MTTFPNSSAIAAADYDAKAERLFITWRKSGDTGVYLKVPAATWHAMLDTDRAGASVGVFVNDKLKPIFDYHLL